MESAAAMFANTDSQSSNQRPMYCKDKIYTGSKEYSFEELRAWNWTAKQRERQQREAEYNQMRTDIMYLVCHIGLEYRTSVQWCLTVYS